MPEDKILSLDQLGKTVLRLKADGKRIVQCHGVFDLLHPGHVRHFASARKKGDVLVVTLTSDRHVHKGPGRPVFNERLRAETVASLAAVDYVAINDAPTAVPAINYVRPDTYVKGNEFEDGKDLHGGIRQEMDAVAAIGGKTEFTGDLAFSSTKLINNFLSPYPEAAQKFLRAFQEKFTFDDIEAYFKKIRATKVLVIGEAIIDEYHYVKAMSKVPKEAIIATRYENEEVFPGGILACANHVAGYCEEIRVVSCLGENDSKEGFVRERLKPNVEAKFFYNPSARTIVKRRFVDPAFLTKLFEVYYFNDKQIPAPVEQKLLQYLEETLPRYDLVIAVDYGHGLFTPALVKCLTERANFLALNTQTNSANFGFHVVTKYPRADYVCIDHIEARLASRQKDVGSIAEWRDIVDGIAGKLNAKNIIITLGHDGCLSYDGDELYHVPVFSTRVLDRVGAGDAFLAVTAPLAHARLPGEALGFVGNAVGALAVEIPGNRQSVEPAPLFKSIQTMLKI